VTWHSGSLKQERFELWKRYAVCVVATKGIYKWWDEEQGRFAFMARVRNLIDDELKNTDSPPLRINEMWKIFETETWLKSANKS